MGWGWTYPDLSLVLAEQGMVRGIITNPVGQKWQPWNPALPSEYPVSVFWHIGWTGSLAPANPGIGK
jgi:hypothetical protein